MRLTNYHTRIMFGHFETILTTDEQGTRVLKRIDDDVKMHHDRLARTQRGPINTQSITPISSEGNAVGGASRSNLGQNVLRRTRAAGVTKRVIETRSVNKARDMCAMR